MAGAVLSAPPVAAGKIQRWCRPPGSAGLSSRPAVLRLGRAVRELGADGATLVHEVLIMGFSMEPGRPAAQAC